MDDTKLHLTIDLGSSTLRDLSRFNTSLAIDIGPHISKSIKYLVYGFVGCKLLQCVTDILLARMAPRKPPTASIK